MWKHDEACGGKCLVFQAQFIGFMVHPTGTSKLRPKEIRTFRSHDHDISTTELKYFVYIFDYF